MESALKTESESETTSSPATAAATATATATAAAAAAAAEAPSAVFLLFLSSAALSSPMKLRRPTRLRSGSASSQLRSGRPLHSTARPLPTRLQATATAAMGARPSSSDPDILRSATIGSFQARLGLRRSLTLGRPPRSCSVFDLPRAGAAQLRSSSVARATFGSVLPRARRISSQRSLSRSDSASRAASVSLSLALDRDSAFPLARDSDVLRLGSLLRSTPPPALTRHASALSSDFAMPRPLFSLARTLSSFSLFLARTRACFCFWWSLPEVTRKGDGTGAEKKKLED